MYSLSFSALFFAATAFGSPLRQHKRYDLDHNGIQDLCYKEKDVTHCMLTNGAWTAMPASSTGTPTGLIGTGTGMPSKHNVGGTAGSALYPQHNATTVSVGATATGVVSGVNPSSLSTGLPSGLPSSASVSPGAVSSRASVSGLPTGTLPDPTQFEADAGSKWQVDYVGPLQFTDQLGADGLGSDKCRSSKLGDKVIWSCGDMECGGDPFLCGFNMGPAFYGTSDVSTIDTDGLTTVNDNTFMQPWSGDAQPEAPQNSWGMDTSNVAAINDTHGVSYAWEIWRGASDGSISDRGNAVASVTLGDTKPIATRVGPLLTGPDAIQLGLLAILRADDYIYTYSIGGPSNVIVGRVAADNSVFDSSQYEFLSYGSTNSWVSGVPTSDTTSIGATTENDSQQFGCGAYGSAFYSNYFNKYVIVCGIYLNYVNMYVSDTPYGPFSAEYQIMSSGAEPQMSGNYGPMVHHAYAPNGSDKEVYISMSPDRDFNLFKITFHY